MNSNYEKKRNLEKSPEPKGSKGSKGKDDSLFVIHKHDASQLHYDFRMNVNGKLKSWAVPKGINLTANEKHLAIRTEDHPYDYADFEGVIPEDEYGGGTVMVWDKGTYKPLKDGKSMEDAIDDGALKFELNGEKLKGGFAMARTEKSSEGSDDDEKWVIFKLDDDEADARRKPTSTEPASAKTARTLEEIEEDEENSDEEGELEEDGEDD